MTIRQIKKTIKGRPTVDGAGVQLVRVLGRGDVQDIDPFLMLDAFDSTNPEDYVRGFPMHPHRGIETITYLIHGQVDHEDSLGNAGSIGNGESQWMTAGSGILHQEMPQPSERMFGLQLWLNMPRKDKMTPPAYCGITPDMIGLHTMDQGTVRVISGQYNDAKGIEPKLVKASVFDVALLPDQEFSLPVPDECTLITYLLEGGGNFDTSSQPLETRTAAVFGPGDTLSVTSGPKGARFMVFYGKPLREPIAWGGPIVMNTEDELQMAFTELRYGSFIK